MSSFKPKRTLPSFRANLYSRTKPTTEKFLEDSTISSLESENNAVEIPPSSEASIEIQSVTDSVSVRKFPTRYNKLKTFTTKTPIGTIKPAGTNSPKRLTPRPYQRRYDKTNNGANLLDDTAKSSSDNDSKKITQKYSSQVSIL